MLGFELFCMDPDFALTCVEPSVADHLKVFFWKMHKDKL